MDNDRYLIWLTHMFGLGAKKLNYLLDMFGSAEEIWYSDKNELIHTGRLTENAAKKIINARKTFDLEACMSRMQGSGILFTGKNDAGYPPLLKEIPDPPVGIYSLGVFPYENRGMVSIIGSRKCTHYGRQMAETLAAGLAKNGLAIVSGMARGLDAAAHEGCIDAGGTTVAVLGCGVDICYPPENNHLYKKITTQGCILSEYPPGTRPLPGFFPARNRIISGLSLATIVVEAGSRSGTMITAGQALEQGREVYAVPGNATSSYSKGTNRLIQEGAALVTSAEDVLQLLNIGINYQNMAANNVENILAPEEELVYDCIGSVPVGIEDIMEKTGTDAGRTQYLLTVLEIKKLVHRLPGQRFIRS